MRFAQGDRIAVLTTQPLDRMLDYLAPEGGCLVGDFLRVPLGPRWVVGVVWGPGTGRVDPAKLRAASAVLDVPPMADELRAFLERTAEYTLTPLTAMLRLATRVPGLMDGVPVKRVVVRSGAEPTRMTEARTRVLDVLDAAGGPMMAGELAREAGVSGSVVAGLVKAGALREEEAPRDVPFPVLDPDYAPAALTPDQAAAAEALRVGLRSGAYGTTLLKGVTGAGKTEVYLEAIAECLRQGRQALVLLPEIALTAEFLKRLTARFGAAPAEWHSGATLTQRRRVWRMVGEGAAQVVIGARSALFLPFRDLGLIVVDEEHDGSYKQDEGVLYNARDMAVMRAHGASARVVLASATPSLESWVNAENGKYERLTLASRFGAATLPEMNAIDLRSEDIPAGRWISDTLAQDAAGRLARGEQVMFFLNRRGFAPVTVCRACGHQIGCPDCDARLVEHRFLKRLVCHQCGHDEPVPEACPACEVTGKLAPVGPGVERLAEEVAERFPEARVAVLSSDLFGTARALKEAVAGIARGDADIVIGTQLVAKGHNFPKLTLVGVIDADLGLQGTDLRAAEHTFQLMRQVAGRAGRAEKPGVARLQTFQPEHPVIRAILSGDEETFWAAEAEGRRAAGMPPFGRLAGIILSGTDLNAVSTLAEHLARNAAPLARAGIEVLGPAPAPIARIRGRHRVRLLLRAPRSAPLQRAIKSWLKGVKRPGDLRLTVDIDPISFL